MMADSLPVVGVVVDGAQVNTVPLRRFLVVLATESALDERGEVHEFDNALGRCMTALAVMRLVSRPRGRIAGGIALLDGLGPHVVSHLRPRFAVAGQAAHATCRAWRPSTRSR